MCVRVLAVRVLLVVEAPEEFCRDGIIRGRDRPSQYRWQLPQLRLHVTAPFTEYEMVATALGEILSMCEGCANSNTHYLMPRGAALRPAVELANVFDAIVELRRQNERTHTHTHHERERH